MFKRCQRKKNKTKTKKILEKHKLKGNYTLSCNKRPHITLDETDSIYP